MIGLLYVLILAAIGVLMLKDALVTLGTSSRRRRRSAATAQPLGRVAALRWRFYSSGLYISPRRAGRARLLARAC